MQVHQRMDLDQTESHHPIKPMIGNNKLNENNAMSKPALKRNNSRSNRVFGQDLTNQQRQIANNSNQNLQKTSKTNQKNQGFNVEKPKIVVIDNEEETEDSSMKDSEQRNVERARKRRKTNNKKSQNVLRRELSVDNDSENEDENIVEQGENEENTEELEEELELELEEEDDIDLKYIIESTLSPWDKVDKNNDIFVTDYIDSIMNNLKDDEVNNFNECIVENEYDFMSSQHDVNSRMRSVLIDWLIEVHRKFKLLPATYFLGINMLDRYMAKKQLHRRKLQLAGCTCLWIASKYHEIYAPEMDDFVYISDNAFSASDLESMEIEILKTLSFTLTVPTVLNYAQRYGKISSYYLKKQREVKIINDLIMYCTENCVLSYDLCRKVPSLLGAACFLYSCLSTKVFSLNTFKRDNLSKVIGYSLSELVPTMNLIHSTVKNAKTSRHKALYKKYCNTKYSNIGKLNFDKLHTSFLNK